jgi:hypothetical protein
MNISSRVRYVAFASCISFMLPTVTFAFETLTCIKLEDLRTADEARTLSSLSRKVFSITRNANEIDIGDRSLIGAGFLVAWSHNGFTVARRDIAEIEDVACLDRAEEMGFSRDRDTRMAQVARMTAQGEIPSVPACNPEFKAPQPSDKFTPQDHVVSETIFFDETKGIMTLVRIGTKDRDIAEVLFSCDIVVR